MPEFAAKNGFAYRAFISYSHRDKAWGDWLHKALETYRVPSRLVGKRTAAGMIPRRLIPIFRDREELASATDLGRKVNEALAQSENLIVICSPASSASRWVNEEVLAYKRMGRAERIFCLIVGGEPGTGDLPGREAEECFCPALRYKLDATGQPSSERVEPIAADARPGKDGKTNAKLKLIAGLLDVGFDALKQRELQRSARRMTAIAALALIVMAVTSGLAVAALIARHQAVTAQQAAERRQKQAENLVDFMLGDLSDKLNQVNRLDILQAVDDKAMAYFVSLPSVDVTDAALAQRIKALEQIGSVRMQQGQTPAALASYEAASELARELSRRAPGDTARAADYADSLKWVGQAYWYQGNLEHALQDFQAAAGLLQSAHAAKPGDNDLTFKLALARNNIGHVLETRGDFAHAHAEYAATLELYRTLAARDPAAPKWQSYIGDAWDNLGKLALEQGRLGEALADYRTDQRIKAALAARDPANHDAQENLLVSNAILGRTLALCGQIDDALAYTRQAVDSARKLTAFDASNAYWQEYVGLYSQQLGGLLRQQGRLADAETVNAEAVRTLSEIVAKDPSNNQWQRELAQSRLEFARLKLRQGDSAAAETLTRAAAERLAALRGKHASDLRLALLAAQADTLLGDLAASHGDDGAVRGLRLRARDAIAPALHAGDDPSALAAAVAILLKLDEPGAAKPLIAKLAAMGYRTPDFEALLASEHIDYAVNATAAQRIVDAMQ